MAMLQDMFSIMTSAHWLPKAHSITIVAYINKSSYVWRSMFWNL